MRKPPNTNIGAAVGVGTSVGVAVGCGVAVEVSAGRRVSIGRGVACGCGGVLTHAANPINKNMSHDHFAIFTPHSTSTQKSGFYNLAFDSIRMAETRFLHHRAYPHMRLGFLNLSR